MNGKARDIQGLEMVPLGPLNGKSIGSTISPWIVTTDALGPFRAAAPEPRVSLAGHLVDVEMGNYDIVMGVEILHGSSSERVVSRIATCPGKELFWSHRQMIAHLTSCGADLRTGDLLGTGTVSGVEEGAAGCLLESTGGGKQNITLADGSERVYLLDGDVVRMTAVLGSEDSGVGFGECIGEISPASSPN